MPTQTQTTRRQKVTLSNEPPESIHTRGAQNRPQSQPPRSTKQQTRCVSCSFHSSGGGGGRTAQGQNHFREDTEFVHERTDAARVPGRRGQDSETHEEERVSRPPCPRRHQRSVQPLYAHVIQRPRRGPMSRARGLCPLSVASSPGTRHPQRSPCQAQVQSALGWL